jgi:hypothetical protein
VLPLHHGVNLAAMKLGRFVLKRNDSSQNNPESFRGCGTVTPRGKRMR